MSNPIIRFKPDGEPYFTLNVENRSEYNQRPVYYRNQYIFYRQKYFNNVQELYNRNVNIFKNAVYEQCRYGKRGMNKRVVTNNVMETLKKLS